MDSGFNILDLQTGTKRKVNIYNSPNNYGFSGDKIVYNYANGFNNNYFCYIEMFDLNKSQISPITSFNNYCQDVKISGNLVIWANPSTGTCYNSKISCNSNLDCGNKYCSYGGNACLNNTDCNATYWDACYSDWCNPTSQLNVYDLNTKKAKIIDVADFYSSLGISGNKIIWIGSYYNINSTKPSGLYIYNVSNDVKEFISSDISYAKIDNDKIVWMKSRSVYSNQQWINLNEIFWYDITNKKEHAIGNTTPFYWYNSPPQIYQNKIIWMNNDEGTNKICENSGKSCSIDSDCSGFCYDTYESCIPNKNSCPGGKWCSSDYCKSSDFYIYDTNTEDNNQISSGKILYFPILVGDSAFWTSIERNEYYIYGYLTIMASPLAIPIKENMGTLAGYENARSLDHTEYGDIYLDDNYPDLSVGRIQGITSSDVSSYVARDLFYDSIGPTNKMKFLASSFDYELNFAANWSASFKAVGYNSSCNIIPTSTSGTNFNCKIDDYTYSYSWPNEWKNKEVISYMDHGSDTWAGISSGDMPYLSNSLVFNDACSTCSTNNGYTFCYTAIRRGAISHAGALSIAWTVNSIYKKTMDGIYYYNFTLGLSFAKAFKYDKFYYMTTLLGDPTLNLNPKYLLKEILLWQY
jgi:hypothetical protein